MAMTAKAPQPFPAPIVVANPAAPADVVRPLDPKLQRVREVAIKGQYQRALELLPADSQDAEIRNCRAVCMIRLHQFEAAFNILRTSVLNSGTQVTRPEVADHIKINFAIALFYGGRPNGAMDVLNEIQREDDSCVKQLRQATAQWVAGMGLLRKLDWKLNHIAPKKLPVAGEGDLGRFVWEVA